MSIFILRTDWIAWSLNTKSLERVQLQPSRYKILSSIKDIRDEGFFPKIEPRRLWKLLDTGTLSSFPPTLSQGTCHFSMLRLCETCYFYITQVLSKRYIFLCPGQKTLCYELTSSQWGFRVSNGMVTSQDLQSHPKMRPVKYKIKNKKQKHRWLLNFLIGIVGTGGSHSDPFSGIIRGKSVSWRKQWPSTETYPSSS